MMTEPIKQSESLFNHDNAPGAQVYEIYPLRHIMRVIEVDAGFGRVVVIDDPIQLSVGNGIIMHTLHFDRIYPIYGGATNPVLFHCYGRQHG